MVFFFFALLCLYGCAHFVYDGKTWAHTDAFGIWVLFMVWLGGASFFKLVLILNGVQ